MFWSRAALIAVDRGSLRGTLSDAVNPAIRTYSVEDQPMLIPPTPTEPHLWSGPSITTTWKPRSGYFAQEPTPRTANRYGVTPLSLAATNRNAAMAEALLKAGADATPSFPGQHDSHGRGPYGKSGNRAAAHRTWR